MENDVIDCLGPTFGPPKNFGVVPL